MPRRKKESESNEKPLKPRAFVLGDYDPAIVEHGKKWAAYDKRGRLIILGYNRRIVENYANDRVRQARYR